MAIRFERDGAVGSIVLANPPFNRLDLRFTEALWIAVHQASESDIRVLVRGSALQLRRRSARMVGKGCQLVQNVRG